MGSLQSIEPIPACLNLVIHLQICSISGTVVDLTSDQSAFKKHRTIYLGGKKKTLAMKSHKKTKQCACTLTLPDITCLPRPAKYIISV